MLANKVKKLKFESISMESYREEWIHDILDRQPDLASNDIVRSFSFFWIFDLATQFMKQILSFTKERFYFMIYINWKSI